MHDADFDHDHEELHARARPLEGLEVLTLKSVGIDIGSSTTHMLFSRLTLRRDGHSHSAQFKVAEREVIWSSPIILTPYLSATAIDFSRIREFIAQCYRDSGFTPQDIDTGAVLITGEALKKENARPILEYFADGSGKFVCASAGPHHEALLAAYGSGAVQLSKARHGTVMNVDIGGGTTKFSLIQSGEILRTAAISVGARLIVFDESGKITRLEDAGALLAKQAGIGLTLGSMISLADRKSISALMGESVAGYLTKGASDGVRQLMITPSIGITLDDIDYLVFSGGVSEYIYSDSDTTFGDLGPELGHALKAFIATLPAGMLQKPREGIRATVIGAGEHTIQVSGTTSFLTDTDILPLQGLKVVSVRYTDDAVFADALAAALRKFDMENFGPGLMLSVSLEGEIDYDALHYMAAAIADWTKHVSTAPLVINVDQDVAHALGRILKEELGLPNAILAIDGITVGDLDFVDIGKPIGLASMFPVTVKSLLFSTAPVLSADRPAK